jgi:hypothetical protein
MVDQHEIEKRLTSLTRDDAKNWITIGRLLIVLEAMSRADSSGRPWQDVVRNRLEELGAPISSGHIYKIRRAIGFLIDHAPDAATPENSSPPKISAIEVAERLYRLDPDAGKKALEDVVGPDQVTYVELQKRYNDALEANPEMKSPRQIAWEARRKSEKGPKGEDEQSSPPAPTPSKEKKPALSDQQMTGPSTPVRRALDELLSQAWAEGQQAAERRYASQISAMQNTIKAQAEEIADSVQEIRDLKGEIAVLSKQVNELRGDYSEDLD